MTWEETLILTDMKSTKCLLMINKMSLKMISLTLNKLIVIGSIHHQVSLLRVQSKNNLRKLKSKNETYMMRKIVQEMRSMMIKLTW